MGYTNTRSGPVSGINAVLQTVGAGAIAGMAAGLVWGGIGGRLAMRLLFLTSGDRVRGLEPWPGAYGFLQGKRLRLCRVETAEGTSQDKPGTVVRVSDYGLEVGTADRRLIITELQPEGKKRMSAGSFLLGHAVTVGEMFETAPEPKIN